MAVAVIFALFLWAQGVIVQTEEYHHFVDTRVFFGINNFFDSISNIFFLFTGILGLYCVFKNREINSLSWAIFFISIILVSIGSFYYHVNPNSQTLIWDRLPMAIGFMALFNALLSEYIWRKADHYFIFPFVLLGISSVLYWNVFGDLRFYYFIQGAPLLMIPFILLLFSSRYTHRYLLLGGTGFYLLAKVAELYDVEIFYFFNGMFISGHTLKHLLAALGIFTIFLMLKIRKLL